MSKKRFTCGIDVGSKKHSLVLLSEEGKIVEKLNVKQNFDSFNESIIELKKCQNKNDCIIEIGIEGKNGYSSPYDRILIKSGFTMYNVDSTKLKKFREIYGADDKTDFRDAHMIALLLKGSINFTSENEKPFEVIKETPVENEKIKQISRFHQDLIEEKTRMVNRLTKYFNSFCPALLEIGNIQSKSILNFLEKYPDPSIYSKLTLKKLLKIKYIGENKAKEILTLIQKVKYDNDMVDTTPDIILSIVKQIINLISEIEKQESKLEKIGEKVENVKRILTVSGIGTILASRFIGEIGSIDNFSNEAKLAAYCGVICLNNDSGETQSKKKIKRSNRICKDTILKAAFLSVKYNKESEKYYLKKRNEYGNRKGAHQHAIRCLARQLIKVIFKILKENRDYEIKDANKKIVDSSKKIVC